MSLWIIVLGVGVITLVVLERFKRKSLATNLKARLPDAMRGLAHATYKYKPDFVGKDTKGRLVFQLEDKLVGVSWLELVQVLDLPGDQQPNRFRWLLEKAETVDESDVTRV